MSIMAFNRLLFEFHKSILDSSLFIFEINKGLYIYIVFKYIQIPNKNDMYKNFKLCSKN